MSQRVANCRRPNAASIPATTRMQRARQAKGRFSAVEVSRLVSARWRKYSAVQGGCGAPAAVAGARPRGGLARLGVRGWRFTARFSGLPSCLSLPSPPAARLESGSSAAPIISLSLEHLRENNCRGRHPATRKAKVLLDVVGASGFKFFSVFQNMKGTQAPRMAWLLRHDQRRPPRTARRSRWHIIPYTRPPPAKNSCIAGRRHVN